MAYTRYSIYAVAHKKMNIDNEVHCGSLSQQGYIQWN